MTETRRQQLRAAQARYRVTEKGKATGRRYRATAKGQAADRRYRYSEKGRAREANGNARLLRVGMTYVGKAATPEQGLRIKAHIKEKLLEFKSRRA